MRTPREEAHAMASGQRWCLHGEPGHTTIRECWIGCEIIAKAIENARADGVVALFREEDQGITGPPPRPMVERTLARLGITLDKFGERMDA
jgi:hypothetical protein